MNFFAEQDKAKRNTSLLIFLLIVAVASLIAITTIALSVFFYAAQHSGSSIDLAEIITSPLSENTQQLLRSDILLWASILITTVVFGGSLYKMAELGGGGYKVAQALGGQVIPPNSTDANERKILNVVEEMAIASGNPVPAVYVMDEDSINAFAAGTNRRNAVIGVTQGCISLLTREELQGVIAHEFSHIHNGDMRLNLRLVAILHGILLIGLMGSFLLRSSAYSGLSRRRNKNTGAQLGAGLALWVLGYCGVFFGSVIKAAVSRQREFLADASAVQFTRNPQGIGNALKKIGGASHHALLNNPKAQEYSHFYFGQGIITKLGGLTATHPPLALRIRRIDKSWDGQFIRAERNDTHQNNSRHNHQNSSHQAASGFNHGAAFAADSTVNKSSPTNKSIIEESIADIGNPEPQHLRAAINTLHQLDSALLNAARDPFSARALIYGLLLDNESKHIAKAQRDTIKAQAHPQTYKEFCQLESAITNIKTEQILPLIECAMPALKQQSEKQYSHFKSVMIELIKADKKVSLVEWCLFRTITCNYEETFDEGSRKLQSVQSEINIVIGAIIYSGENTDPQEAFNAAKNSLAKLDIHYLDGNKVTFQALDRALARLCQLRPLEKPTLLKALAACIYADGKITAKEQLMFRAIADVLNCPVPLTEPTPTS